MKFTPKGSFVAREKDVVRNPCFSVTEPVGVKGSKNGFPFDVIGVVRELYKSQQFATDGYTVIVCDVKVP